VTGGGLPSGTMGRIGLNFALEPERDLCANRSGAGQGTGAGRGGGSGRSRGGGGGGGGQALPDDDKVSGIWRSSDGGRTWQFRSNQNNRPMYYSQIRVDPNDENTVYVGGAGASKSTDGAKTFNALTGFGHGDHHAIWINPKDASISRERGWRARA
jgi:hypothetical protein